MNNNDKIISVVLGCDQNYFKYAAVTIQSILENCSPNYQYKFFMIVDSSIISLSAKEQFLKIRTERNIQFEIEFLSIDGKIFSNLNVLSQITRATYFRLLIPEIISYDKVIYLDCDTIVKHDISELYNYDLGDNLVGAIKDILDPSFKHYVESINLNPDNYFNAGVLLINNKKWIQENIGRKCINYLEEHPNIKFLDQDALNIICNNRVFYIDRKWNFFWYYSIELVKMKGFLDHEIQEVYNNLSKDFYIIHYTSAYKPWKKRYFKYADLWWKYAKLTNYYKELFWESELISHLFFRKLLGVTHIEISGERYKIVYILFLKLLFKK